MRTIEDKGVAVEIVRAAFGDDVDCGVGGEAILGVKAQTIDLKFLNRLNTHISDAEASRTTLVFAAVDGHIVRTPAASADRNIT